MNHTQSNRRSLTVPSFPSIRNAQKMAKKNAKKKAIDEAAALAAEEDEFELEDLGN